MAVCVAYNVISLIAILTAPETLGIDMNRVDPLIDPVVDPAVDPTAGLTLAPSPEHPHG